MSAGGAAGEPEPFDDSARRVSRAPVVVVLGGFAVAVALVLLGARLSATPGPTPDLSEPGTAEQPRAVNVLLHDYSFNPRTLYLVAGETVRFEVVNAGLVDHEFVLGDGNAQRAWAEANARATPPAAFATPPPASVGAGVAGLRTLLAPGRSSSLLYEVPRGPALQLMCHLPGHVERGMVGRVVVASP